MAPDKMIGMALRSLDDWESLGKCRRVGKQARWFVRRGFDNQQEFIPASSIRGVGASPGEDEPSIDDMLG